MNPNQPESPTSTEEQLINITEEAHLYDQKNVIKAFEVVRAEMERIECETLEHDTPVDSPEADKERRLEQAMSLPRRSHELSIAALALTALIQRERQLYGLDTFESKLAEQDHQATQPDELQNDETHNAEPIG